MHSQQQKLIIHHLWPQPTVSISIYWGTDDGMQSHLCCLSADVHRCLETLQTSILPLWYVHWMQLALLRVVLSARPRPQLLWRWGDEKETWVTFGHLLVVVHVTPLSLPYRGASIVRVGRLMLRPVWLVPKPSSGAILIPWGAVTTASPSPPGGAAPMSSPVCGADARHVGPLRQNLQDKEDRFRTF